MAALVFTKVQFSTCGPHCCSSAYWCTIDCLLSHQNLQDLYASEGQLVVLECRVKGVPSPRVAWYRGESVIEDSPDFRILQKSEAF